MRFSIRMLALVRRPLLGLGLGVDAQLAWAISGEEQQATYCRTLLEEVELDVVPCSPRGVPCGASINQSINQSASQPASQSAHWSSHEQLY